MSVWESKAAGPVWRSRGGEDRRTVPELSSDDIDPSFHSQELTNLCATLQIRLEATLDLTATHHRRLHTTDVYTPQTSTHWGRFGQSPTKNI
ncbi:unnamed protein product [Pleuronectes platessa]|uniref:Uncharacterized protein n=1 Tax=Pleuronectes platessa TaxID=8262 RepID=A0A9N7YDN4_PLEPL|nr:unnamed protein product [Pleuronectes platessa]